MFRSYMQVQKTLIVTLFYTIYRFILKLRVETYDKQLASAIVSFLWTKYGAMKMTNCIQICDVEKSHLYRQAIATFASSFLSIGGGLTFGFSAVLLPQLKEDTTFPYDESHSSWIASISPLSMVLGCLWIGTIIDKIGRRAGHILIACPFLLGWIVLGFANNTALLLLGRFLTGLCTGAVRPASIVYIGEIADPKYRGIALFCPSLAFNLGMLVSHVIGTYLYWRTGALVCGVFNVIAFAIIITVKESPSWLISKGRADLGTQAFQWLRGNDEAANKELNIMLEKQRDKATQFTSKQLLNIIMSRNFIKPFVTVFLLFLGTQFSGINTLSFYAQDILKNTFSGEIDTFLLMMVTDCIRVFTSLVICGFGKILPRKITFLSSCFTTSIVLYCLVIFLKLNPPGLVWIPLTCIVAYIGLASAMVSMSWSFVAEIFPAQVRGLSSGICSAICFTLLFIIVKITPHVMNNFGREAMYSGFATTTLVCALFLCFILPETNGRSLQDIEDSYNKKDIQFVSRL